MLSAHFDYLTFTWSPQGLEPIKRLSRSVPEFKERLEEIYNAANIKNIETVEGRYFGVDLNKYDMMCSDELLRFFADVNPFYGKFVEVKERPYGMFGYKRSWELHVEGVNVGVAAAGAKNGGCMISLTGAGCSGLDYLSMHKALKGLPYVKLTRADIAFDSYDGKYSIDVARSLYKNGSFITRGKPPKYRYIEGGHLQGKKLIASGGRSFYIGTRESGKMLRIYEKGKQLQGQGERITKDWDNWTRWELELRSTQRHIPLDILLEPARYLRDSYPAMQFIGFEEPENEKNCAITCKRKEVKITVDHLIFHARKAYGPLINVLEKTMDKTPSEIVQLLISKKPDAIPRRINRALALA